jgi:spore coat protein CotH
MSTSYDDVFDDSYMHEVNLYLSSADWKQLRRHYKQNIWFEAEFYLDDRKLQLVGIRSRGMSSRDGDKPGILIDCGYFKRGRELFAVKSLVLRNMASDGSFMRERLANKIFIRSGLAAPLMVSAKVYVNDKYVGLYAMTESVDRHFLCSRFGRMFKGKLFKYRWKDEWYFEERKKLVTKLFSPRTNVGEPDDVGINELVDVINHGSVLDIGEKLDLEWTLQYLAVENAIAEIDGVVGDWGVNNFYICEGGDGRFRFIPWDMEAGFRNADHSIWNNAGDNRLTRGLFQDDKIQKRYREALWEVVKKSVNEDWLIPEIDRIEDQIQKAAYNDPFGRNFDKQVNKLRKFSCRRKESVRKQLEHNVILPFGKY